MIKKFKKNLGLHGLYKNNNRVNRVNNILGIIMMLSVSHIYYAITEDAYVSVGTSGHCSLEKGIRHIRSLCWWRKRKQRSPVSAKGVRNDQEEGGKSWRNEVNAGRVSNVGLMLVQRCRLWTNIKPTLDQCLAFSWVCGPLIAHAGDITTSWIHVGNAQSQIPVFLPIAVSIWNSNLIPWSCWCNIAVKLHV